MNYSGRDEDATSSCLQGMPRKENFIIAYIPIQPHMKYKYLDKEAKGVHWGSGDLVTTGFEVALNHDEWMLCSHW